jgi:hypothetical protein
MASRGREKARLPQFLNQVARGGTVVAVRALAVGGNNKWQVVAIGIRDGVLKSMT